jgi:hypothetical protein
MDKAPGLATFLAEQFDECVEAFRWRIRRTQYLERDLFLELPIFGEPDLTHTAAPQLADE